MKTCEACGYDNDEDAEFCARCGASLREIKYKTVEKKDDECFGADYEGTECFGLPYGGAICGIIIGIFIIIWALATFFSWPIWEYLWMIGLILLGVLIIAGAIYGIRRSQRA